MKHYDDTYKVVLRRPDGSAFAAIGGLPDIHTAEAVIVSQTAFCQDKHGFTPEVRVWRLSQGGATDVTAKVFEII